MTVTKFAKEARQTKAEHAALIGIDEDLISDLVETFYARIRSHTLLGPIFEQHVDDWSVHLQKMKNFWASIAVESGRFHGNPMAKHIAIGSLERRHFDAWLVLFSETLDDVVKREQAHAFFKERAAKIAESLHMGVDLHRHGLGGTKSPNTREEE